jgi:phosphohistidine phosphatase
MEIYLIRHGIAAERGTYLDDDARPLIDRGISKTHLVAKRCRSIGLQFDLIQTSPLVRAEQTTKILQEEGLGSQIERCDWLAPDGDIQQWLQWLKSFEKKDDGRLALVGHQPDLGDWAELLVWGQSQAKIILKKAGIIGLNVNNRENAIGNCQLFLLIPPKWSIVDFS